MKSVERPVVGFLATGGTIDKVIDSKSELSLPETSNVPDMLREARISERSAKFLGQIVMKDSQFMVEEDRKEILEQLVDSATQEGITRFVVTHGTDTMTETAKTLNEDETLRKLGATVVLTGAMIPYSNRGSDALANIGHAMATAQTQDEGVFISMGGEAYREGEVWKNREAGEFQAIPTEVDSDEPQPE